MLRFLFGVLLVVVIVIGVLWITGGVRPGFREEARATGAETREELAEAGRETRDGLREAGRETREAIDDLNVDRIWEELKQTGRVVRRKAAAGVEKLDASTQDSRTTAQIEARFALDDQLRARDIDVDTRSGRVTLSGRVDTPDQVARAIRIALEDDDVVEVTSTLQVTRQGGLSNLPAAEEPAATPTPVPVP